ncbi:hypothetical protein ACFFX0_07405 [Citricoccus parietis]|uniref:Uncharacterized protein n=1 Tax=Citricoccus parietis TaxID=592307 RepID=A0ABV5FWH9_9MICC
MPPQREGKTPEPLVRGFSAVWTTTPAPHLPAAVPGGHGEGEGPAS